MLFLKDAAGTQRAGRVVGVDENSFKLEVPLAVGSAATATVTVPRSEVDRIEFAPNPLRDRLIADPTIAGLAGEWRRWQGFLAIPRSPAPAIGSAYATALLADPARAAEALAVFERIEAESWSEEAKQSARQGRLRAMVATGRAQDAVGEARKLAEESEDPSVLIEAKFILAEAAFAELQQLVEENPRWTEDLLVRPEYERLYNEALDLYLHPPLFIGSEIDAASRGLWGAAQVYRFGGDERNAAESARDVVMLYPGTSFATLGQEYLDTLSDESNTQDDKTNDENGN